MDKIFHVNQDVSTVHGPGVVQGRLRDADGSVKVLVSHDPRKVVNLPDCVLAGWHGGPWVLYAYDAEDVEARNGKL